MKKLNPAKIGKLTERQRRFVENFAKTGNASEAARLAGYKSPGVEGHRLLKNAKIACAIEAISSEVTSKNILSIEERKERLTELSESENEPAAIKAIDTLNKMDAVYIQKLDIRAQLSKTPEQIESDVIQTYRENPELWKRIKEAVER